MAFSKNDAGSPIAIPRAKRITAVINTSIGPQKECCFAVLFITVMVVELLKNGKIQASENVNLGSILRLDRSMYVVNCRAGFCERIRYGSPNTTF